MCAKSCANNGIGYSDVVCSQAGTNKASSGNGAFIENANNYMEKHGKTCEGWG